MIMNQFNSICNVVNQFKKTILKTEQDFIGAPHGIVNVNENTSSLDSPSLSKNHHLIQSPTKLPYSAYIANHNNNNNNNNNNNLNGVSTLSPILSPNSLLSGANSSNNNNNISSTSSPILNSYNGNGGSVGISVKLFLGNNKKSTIYILANIALCNISNCHDSIIVLGPCIDYIEVNDCSKLTIISITKNLRIKSSNNITLYICTNQKPVITSDCHDIKLAPYNTHYPTLDVQITTSKLSTNLSNNLWDTPLVYKSLNHLNSQPFSNVNASLSTSTSTTTTTTTISITPPPKLPLEPLESNEQQPDKEGSLENKEDPEKDDDSENNEITDNLKDIYSILDPEEFFPFTVPFLIKGKTKSNPCELPPNYIKSLSTKTNSVHALHKLIQQTTNDPKTKATLLHLIESKFQEWLVETDNIRQINDLINMKR